MRKSRDVKADSDRRGVFSVPVNVNSALALLPSFVVIPIQNYFGEENEIVQLHYFCDAAEVLTRFLTILALGEVRYQSPDGSLGEQVLRVVRPRIERPTFGQWAEMLEALTAPLVSAVNPMFPGLASFVVGRVLPALHGNKTCGECGIIPLRNDVVHGGAITRAAARSMLAGHATWFEDLLPDMVFLAGTEILSVEQEGARALAGASPDRGKIEPFAARVPSLSTHAGRVVAVRGCRILELWPLFQYGRAVMTSFQGVRKSALSSPMVYFRSERDRLLYAALGGELPRGEYRDTLAEFRELFLLGGPNPEQRDSEADFEAEIRNDSASLVGRVEEVRHAKAIIKEQTHGVCWIGGAGGIGKSFLMARIAADLGSNEKHRLRIAWRFKAGDGARCNSGAFFRHAVSRLAPWLGRHDVVPAGDPRILRGQLDELFVAVGDAGSKRVVILLDGMDEIERIEADFPRVPFQFDRHNVLWVCAGRSEGNLLTLFSPERCTHVFHDRQGRHRQGFSGDLPAMSDADIRGMLLDETGSLKYELLKLDDDTVRAGGVPPVINEAVDAVVRCAKGLPLYVRFVVEDIMAGHFRFAQLGKSLPSGLPHYYDDLLGRLKIGALHALLTPLIVTLVWSRAGLGVDMLHLLMIRRKTLVPGEKDRDRIRQGLEAMQCMVRPTQSQGGERTYEPYHLTFTEHVREDRAGIIGSQNQLARDEFSALALDWAILPEDHAIRNYALLWGPRHLQDDDRWSDLGRILTDLAFLEAKCTAGMTFLLVADFQHALTSGDGFAAEPRSQVAGFGRFLRLHGHILAKNPALVFQQAANQQSEPAPALAARQRLSSGCERRPWLRRLNPPPLPAGCEMTLAGHLNSVIACAFSPDGAHVASGSRDSTVKVWDVATGAEIATLWGHTGQVRGLAYAPNGRRLVSGASDGRARIWDADTCAELRVLHGHTAGVECCAYSSRLIVTGAYDRAARVWDATSYEQIAVLEDQEAPVRACAFSTNETQFATGAADGFIHIYDSVSRERQERVLAHRGAVRALRFGPHGRVLASAGNDGKLRVWDLDTGDVKIIAAHGSNARACGFLGDGRWLVSASEDLTIRVWEIATKREVRRVKAHSRWITCGAVSCDRMKFASGSDDATLKIWDFGTLEEGREIAGSVSSRRNPESEVLSVRGAAESVAPVEPCAGHNGPIFAVAFSKDGERFVTASSDNNLIVWNARDGRAERLLKGHDAWVRGCAFTPDGARIVSASWDKSLRVWDAATGECLMVLPGDGRAVWGCAVDPTGMLVASVSEDGAVRFWSLATMSLAGKRLQGHPGTATCCGFSPDGRFLVSGATVGPLIVWDVETRTQAFVLEGHEGTVRTCGFSPDGRRIVSGADDRTARTWDARSGQLLATLAGHEGQVWACAVTPDGSLIASASSDQTVRLWDTGDAREIAAIRGHTAEVWACAFSSDGRKLLTASFDMTLRLWDVSSGSELMTLASRSPDVRVCALSSAGDLVVAGRGDGTCIALDAVDGAELFPGAVHRASVGCCEISPDGERFVTGSDDGTLVVRDFKTGKDVVCFAHHDAPVRACVFSPKGNEVVSAGNDATVRIWNASTGRERIALHGHEGWVGACAVVPRPAGGFDVVSGSSDGTLRLWDGRTGEAAGRWGDESWPMTCVAVSSDGQYVVAGGGTRGRGVAVFVNLRGSREEQFLEGHDGPMTVATFSRDGQRMVTAAVDGTVICWDVRTAEPIAKFRAHGGPVTAGVFLEGGHLFASASAKDRVVCVREADSGRLVGEYWGESGFLAIAGHGTVLAVGDAGGAVHLLRIENLTTSAFSLDGEDITSTCTESGRP